MFRVTNFGLNGYGIGILQHLFSLLGGEVRGNMIYYQRIPSWLSKVDNVGHLRVACEFSESMHYPNVVNFS